MQFSSKIPSAAGAHQSTTNASLQRMMKTAAPYAPSTLLGTVAPVAAIRNTPNRASQRPPVNLIMSGINRFFATTATMLEPKLRRLFRALMTSAGQHAGKSMQRFVRLTCPLCRAYKP